MEIDYKFISFFAKDIVDNKELTNFRKSLEPFCDYMISLFYSAGDNPLVDQIKPDEAHKIIKDFFSIYAPDVYESILNIESFAHEDITYIFKNGEQEKLDFLLERLEESKRLGNINDKTYQNLKKFHTSAFKVRTGDSRLTPYGKVKLVTTGTTEDIFIYIHELMHKVFWQSVDEDDREITHEYLIEVNSIILELLLHDYLIESNFHVEDAKRYKLNRFTNTLEMAYFFKFESLLLQIIENEGEITSLNIDQYIRTCSDSERKEFEEYKLLYLDLIQSEGFHFIINGLYIFGLFAACYIKKKIDENKENTNLLYLIGKNIYESDVEVALKNCGLDFFTTNHGEIEFDTDKLNEIGDAFTSEAISLQNRSRK